MSKLQFVGTPTNNVDGFAKVMGKAKYVGDMNLPGMLFAQVLRSPIPHGKIVKLNTAPALKIPGVLAVVTSEDFVDHGLWGWPIKDSYVFAYQKVRHVGDPIATVAAETLQAARAGLEAIELELEELPGVFDLRKALDADAPLISQNKDHEVPNLVEIYLVRNGKPEEIIGKSPVVLDETYFFHHQEHAYLETEGVLAIPNDDGGVTVYSNDQSPFINLGNLVMLLDLPEQKVRVIQPPVGGSFGGKDDINYQNSAQAAKLSLLTKRPVRLTLTREESIIASYKREAMQIKINLGADKDGTLKAAKVNIIADSGGYPSETSLASWRGTMHVAGAYRYDAVEVDTDVVYTNNSYCGAFRGFGNTEATGAIEQAVDELAERLNIDPIEFRLRNALHQGDTTMTGNVIKEDVGLTDCIHWVHDQSDWKNKRASYAHQQVEKEIRRGIGVACYFHGSGLGGEGDDIATCTIKIEKDYSVTITSGLTDYGQGSRTTFTLIAAESLGVKPDRIQILRPDTQTAIDSGPTVASRSTMIGGNSMRVAGQNLNRLLISVAATALHCTPGQITRLGENYMGPDEEPLTFNQIVDHANEMGLTLSANGTWQMPKIEWHFDKGVGIPYYCYSYGAVVAEVEVDSRIGTTDVLNIWMAHDGGTIIFPQGARGQMLGGIAQGLGYALMEEMKYNQGYPQVINFDNLLIPTALDMPQVKGKFVETNFKEGPYGAKNLAEPMMIGIAPAIANAIAQATGFRGRVTPMTYEGTLLGHDLIPSAPIKEIRQVLGFKS
ncbi:MAG: xanthine dehydrogenase family protein molybdopterin-binding subunit [Leptolinea sp.]